MKRDTRKLRIKAGDEALFLACIDAFGYQLIDAKNFPNYTDVIITRHIQGEIKKDYAKRERDLKKVFKKFPIFSSIILALGIAGLIAGLILDGLYLKVSLIIISSFVMLGGVFGIISFLIMKVHKRKIVLKILKGNSIKEVLPLDRVCVIEVPGKKRMTNPVPLPRPILPSKDKKPPVTKKKDQVDDSIPSKDNIISKTKNSEEISSNIKIK